MKKGLRLGASHLARSRFERGPDEEGIETHLASSPHQRSFERGPDEEGIETQRHSGVGPLGGSNADLMKKGLRLISAP